jgi:DHA1 family multidrug resistance protein-like MFS transporter
MWSFHQYKRIGQQVRKERRNSPSVENGEKASSKSPVRKDSKGTGSQDEHIFVRESGENDPLDPKNV